MDVRKTGAKLYASRPDLHKKLTPAERDIARMILEGYSGPEISAKRARALGTTHGLTRRVRRCLGVDSNVGLVYLFLDKGVK